MYLFYNEKDNWKYFPVFWSKCKITKCKLKYLWSMSRADDTGCEKVEGRLRDLSRELWQVNKEINQNILYVFVPIHHSGHPWFLSLSHYCQSECPGLHQSLGRDSHEHEVCSDRWSNLSLKTSWRRGCDCTGVGVGSRKACGVLLLHMASDGSSTRGIPFHGH